MARGRLITQEMSTNPTMNGMSINAHYCYMLAFAYLDQDGLIDGDPTNLWAIICPLRYDLRELMPQIINEWITSGLVIRVTHDPTRTTLLFRGEYHEQTYQ